MMTPHSMLFHTSKLVSHTFSQDSFFKNQGLDLSVLNLLSGPKSFAGSLSTTSCGKATKHLFCLWCCWKVAEPIGIFFILSVPKTFPIKLVKIENKCWYSMYNMPLGVSIKHITLKNKMLPLQGKPMSVSFHGFYYFAERKTCLPIFFVLEVQSS